jgi:hypothetical protein
MSANHHYGHAAILSGFMGFKKPNLDMTNIAFWPYGLQLRCDFLERALARPLPHCDNRCGAANRRAGKVAS